MQLQRIEFNFDMPSEKFTRLTYLFKINLENLDKQKLADEVQSTFNSPDSLITEHFAGTNLKKEKEADSSESFVQFGYAYEGIRNMRTSFWKVIEQKFHANLKCRIYAPLGKVNGVNFDFFYRDEQDFLLKLYDSILAIPSIYLSKDAEYSSKRIAILRSSKDFLKNPLKLLP